MHGRVQGVGFRHFTRVAASRIGLRGTVRNLRDGTVEIHVSGPPAAVEELRERVSEGPRSARVTRIEETGAAPAELPETFEVRF